MVKESHLLSEKEEEEYLELEETYKKQIWLKNMIGVLIIVLVGVLVIGFIKFYPFLSKVNGKWVDAELGNYELVNKSGKSTFTIQRLQGNKNVNLVFKGDLYQSGSNRYKVKNNEVYLEIDKEGVEKKVLDSFKQKSDTYQVETDNAEFLRLKYTKEAKKEAFPDTNIDDLFYYTIDSFKYGIKSNSIKLRNSEFAVNPIVFEPSE